MGKDCLTGEQIQDLVRILTKLLDGHFERQAARLEQRKDEDYDDVVEESLLDEVHVLPIILLTHFYKCLTI